MVTILIVLQDEKETNEGRTPFELHKTDCLTLFLDKSCAKICYRTGCVGGAGWLYLVPSLSLAAELDAPGVCQVSQTGIYQT